MEVITIVHIITYIIAAASVVVNITPTPKDNEIYNKIIKVIQGLALNFKK